MSIRHQQEKANLLIQCETWDREVAVKRALEKIQRTQTQAQREQDYQTQQAAILKQNSLGENWISSTLKPRMVQYGKDPLNLIRQGWSIFVPDDRMKEAQKIIGGKLA